MLDLAAGDDVGILVLVRITAKGSTQTSVPARDGRDVLAPIDPIIELELESIERVRTRNQSGLNAEIGVIVPHRLPSTVEPLPQQLVSGRPVDDKESTVDKLTHRRVRLIPGDGAVGLKLRTEWRSIR